MRWRGCPGRSTSGWPTLRRLALTVHLWRRGSALELRGRRPPEAPGAAGAPDVVVFGMGDSGTRGVKEALEALGVSFCPAVNPTQDNTLTMRAHGYIPELLLAARGRANDRGAYARSARFSEAVRAERRGAALTKQCIDAAQKEPPSSSAWGFKNPRHMFLMPVVDAAFSGAEHMLAVARDPRDVCTSRNQAQLKAYRSLVLGPPAVDGHDLLDPLDCLKFWATLWHSTLTGYQHAPNFRVVRIEDLVVPEPHPASSSMGVLSCVARHAKVQPDEHTRLTELQRLHKHSSSYMGHHYGFTDESRSLVERYVAARTDEPLIHQVMQQLGYDTHRYGLLEPRSSLVCRH